MSIKYRVLSIKLVLLLFTLNTYYLIPNTVVARTTPEDIVNAKKEEYQTQVRSYSQESRERLEKISARLVEINRVRTDQLSRIMETQGRVLDELVSRNGGEETEAVEKARYWITFAHEAVAYQAAKVYVYDLSSEANLEPDIKRLVGQVRGELNSAREKVINSQKILKQLVRSN